MNDLYPTMNTTPQFADFALWRDPPKTLQEKITLAREYYKCDVLFVHRDAETGDSKIIQQRKQEVAKAKVPIRMTEAWLLIDSEAIKKAAGNRNYKEVVLPAIKNIEKENDPKEYLLQLLKKTSEKKGRHLARFDGREAIRLVVEYIENFALLRQLPAFQVFEDDVKIAIQNRCAPPKK